jgi:hypothetical protein
VAESLRLFEMAKTATNNPQREYPYINSGRAYMIRKQYHLALRELQIALTLAPYHQNLHKTVQTLMNTLLNQNLCSSEKLS